MGVIEAPLYVVVDPLVAAFATAAGFALGDALALAAAKAACRFCVVAGELEAAAFELDVAVGFTVPVAAVACAIGEPVHARLDTLEASTAAFAAGVTWLRSGSGTGAAE